MRPGDEYGNLDARTAAGDLATLAWKDPESAVALIGALVERGESPFDWAIPDSDPTEPSRDLLAIGFAHAVASRDPARSLAWFDHYVRVDGAGRLVRLARGETLPVVRSMTAAEPCRVAFSTDRAAGALRRMALGQPWCGRLAARLGSDWTIELATRSRPGETIAVATGLFSGRRDAPACDDPVLAMLPADHAAWVLSLFLGALPPGDPRVEDATAETVRAVRRALAAREGLALPDREFRGKAWLIFRTVFDATLRRTFETAEPEGRERAWFEVLEALTVASEVSLLDRRERNVEDARPSGRVDATGVEADRLLSNRDRWARAMPPGAVWIGFRQLDDAQDVLAYALHHDACTRRVRLLLEPGVVPQAPGAVPLEEVVAGVDRRLERHWRRWRPSMENIENSARVLDHELGRLIEAHSRRLGPILEQLLDLPDSPLACGCDLIIQDDAYPACPWDLLKVGGRRLVDLVSSITLAFGRRQWMDHAMPRPRRPFDAYVGHLPQEAEDRGAGGRCAQAPAVLDLMRSLAEDAAALGQAFLTCGAEAPATCGRAEGVLRRAGTAIIVGHGRIGEERGRSGIELFDGKLHVAGGIDGLNLLALSCLVGRTSHEHHPLDRRVSEPYGPLIDLHQAGATMIMSFTQLVPDRHAGALIKRLYSALKRTADPHPLAPARIRRQILQEILRDRDGAPEAGLPYLRILHFCAATLICSGFKAPLRESI